MSVAYSLLKPYAEIAISFDALPGAGKLPPIDENECWELDLGPAPTKPKGSVPEATHFSEGLVLVFSGLNERRWASFLSDGGRGFWTRVANLHASIASAEGMSASGNLQVCLTWPDSRFSESLIIVSCLDRLSALREAFVRAACYRTRELASELRRGVDRHLASRLSDPGMALPPVATLEVTACTWRNGAFAPWGYMIATGGLPDGH